MSNASDLISIRGHRALITGANGCLGRVFSEALAEVGADLVLVDRPESNLCFLKERLSNTWKVNVCSYSCDLEDESQRNSMIQAVKSDGKGLSCLINNAAFIGASSLHGWAVPFEEQSVETWRRAFEVNLTAAFHLSQSFAPELRHSSLGSIINIGSIYGTNAPDWRLYEGTDMGNPAAYSASKAGLLQLTRWLATTLAPDIRVNAISPGGIYRGQPDTFVQRYISKTPLRRMAVEEDFRGAVLYLATRLSAYVTGHNLVVDGGWSAW